MTTILLILIVLAPPAIAWWRTLAWSADAE
jgi:hypothetical protein